MAKLSVFTNRDCLCLLYLYIHTARICSAMHALIKKYVRTVCNAYIGNASLYEL